ncbi:sensor histidine kinase [Gorillibacterium timonense]|uniref:sensor histidine kinase n=1 Tax=Gorillibacterium timonense TaxID=1689269 RepID=UPI00071D2EB5|nr:HAMP domain-containing sensor histidine kinase [Gorillibacterium timonense]
MSKQSSRLVAAARASGTVLFLITMSALFFTIGFFVLRWTGYGPLEDRGSFLPYLGADLIGMFLFMLCAFLVHLFVGPNKREVWKEVNEALRRVARGDFNVILPERGDEDGRLREFRESINEMVQELKQVEGMRQEFISTVSHEIQSPLTSIRGFAVALQDDRLSPAERRHYLSIIEAESIRLSRLGDNLLRLTTLEGDGPVLNIHAYRLDSQIRKAVLTLEPQWLDKGQEMDVELAPLTVSGDEQFLDQVWINLLHNAIKFTPSGGTIRVIVEERTVGMDRKAVVKIADSGPGIPQADQLRIFERFYRGDKSRNRTTEGNGLGLSIVKKIVDLHGGTIAVKSRPGEGAEFEVALPRTE